MGTHPSGHAALASKEHLTLAAWLEDHPEALGQQVLDHFGSGLPFLLKASYPPPPPSPAFHWLLLHLSADLKMPFCP